MRSRFTRQQKLEIIMECRNSGLSDYQWCKQHSISTSTFYGWVNQLKKAQFDIPDSVQTEGIILAPTQDVVKLEVVEEPETPYSVPALPVSAEPVITTPSYAVEISLGSASIKISNDVSPVLLSTIMKSIGGALC